MYISLSLTLSLSFSLLFPQSSSRFYTVALLGALPAESPPAVPEETNGDREKHSKAPAFKDLKGGDRERERVREREHSYDTFRGWDSGREKDREREGGRWQRGREQVGGGLCSFQKLSKSPHPFLVHTNTFIWSFFFHLCSTLPVHEQQKSRSAICTFLPMSETFPE